MRFIASFVLLVACGARSEIGGVVAVEDASTPDVHDATVDHHDATPDVADAGCSVILSVGTIVPTPSSCWIDQKVSNETKPLVWDCETGAAEADFDVPFKGTVDKNGVVSIAATTTFPWSDGCTWESTQAISGTLSTKTLEYSYSEHPISGVNCAPAYCTSKATVIVE